MLTSQLKWNLPVQLLIFFLFKNKKNRRRKISKGTFGDEIRADLAL